MTDAAQFFNALAKSFAFGPTTARLEFIIAQRFNMLLEVIVLVSVGAHLVRVTGTCLPALYGLIDLVVMLEEVEVERGGLAFKVSALLFLFSILFLFFNAALFI